MPEPNYGRFKSAGSEGIEGMGIREMNSYMYGTRKTSILVLVKLQVHVFVMIHYICKKDM